MKIKIQDITGQLFGKLTAIELDETLSGKGKGSFWKCKCDCGNTKTVHLNNLRRGNTKSCGCMWMGWNGHRYGKSSNHPSYTGVGDMPGTYYSQIKRSAKERNMEFNLSKEYLWNLFLKQNRKCALSGIDISFRTNQHIADGTASLDRVNSTKDYIEGNVQWVHKDINNMKQKYSNEYFLSLCKSVSEYRK